MTNSHRLYATASWTNDNIFLNERSLSNTRGFMQATETVSFTKTSVSPDPSHHKDRRWLRSRLLRRALNYEILAEDRGHTWRTYISDVEMAFCFIPPRCCVAAYDRGNCGGDTASSGTATTICRVVETWGSVL